MASRTDIPTPDETTSIYWEATAQQRLLIKHCQTCGRSHFYPRPFCPHCWSNDVEWLEASGRANLYTYSIVYSNSLAPFSSQVPYVAAIVELEENVRMITNVVDCPFEELELGMALEVTFRKVEDFAIPEFRPAADEGGVS
jgi:uncharacterized OB-fold protein